MKLIVTAAAAALLALGTAAHAQVAAFGTVASPVYGELGTSWLNMKSNGATADAGALRGIIGYDVHPNLAFEGMLMGGLSSDRNGGVEMKLHNSYGVFAKPKYDFGNVEVFGRLGWAHTSLGASCAAGCRGTSANDVAYGAGVNYSFNPRMSVGLDYTRYLDKGNAQVGGLTVGFGYRF